MQFSNKKKRSTLAILRAIQYFTTKKKHPFVYDDIQSFFKNGISFPEFVSLAFDINIDKFGKLHHNPIYDSDILSNNDKAYQYVLRNCLIIENDNEYWESLEQNLGHQKKHIIFLSLLLVERCFHIKKHAP